MIDIPTGKVVTNDFPWITHDFFFEWRAHHKAGAPNLWPEALRGEMTEVMDRMFTDVNNGVYQCGFAATQSAYKHAYGRLWAALDWLEDRLQDRTYLMGEQLTEADVRLFTTLARFDAAYHGLFKTNRTKLTEMPNLWRYAKHLYSIPEFGSTINFEQIKRTTTSSSPT
jgi:putative glutathione S-transferase